MAIAQPPIYQELYRFLASSPTHQEIMAFSPSVQTQKRIQELLQLNRENALSTNQQAELDEYERIEHIVRMLKLHTHELMQQS